MIRYVEFPHHFDFDVTSKDNFSRIKLVRNIEKGAKRMLYVLEYIPSDDLQNLKGNLLSGTAEDTFKNLIAATKLPKHDYLVCSFNVCRTMGKPEDYKKVAEEEFASRIIAIIEQYKPEGVVIFGTHAFNVMCKDIRNRSRNENNFLGVPIKKALTIETKEGKVKHTVSIVKSIKIDGMFLGNEASISMAGYVMSHIKNAYYGKLIYQIKRPEMKVVAIDTIKKFDKFYKMLVSQKIVSIDTETDNLNKIKNRVLLIQFSFDDETSYIIPLCHKDTPFSGEELAYIFKKMRRYFEFDSQADYHIFANAQFDLNVMRTQFRVRFYKTALWDIFSAEMCFAPDTIVDTEYGMISIVDLVSMENRPRVLSYNHSTCENEYKSIIQACAKENTEPLYKIEYEGGSVKVTGNHKVWSVTRNDYVEAKDLVNGETVLNSAFNEVKISITMSEPTSFVYDVTVEDNHNLYVCSESNGNSRILVHNCLDENLKFLDVFTGKYYYSLGNLSCQYGDTFYLDATFGKADRDRISKADLTHDVMLYCAADTVIPFAIHVLQKQRAKDIKYDKYLSIVTEQMSDVIHSLATLEYNGYPVDKEYLFKLKLPDSPIEQELESMGMSLAESDAAKKASALILKESGVPEQTLFGGATVNAFSLRKKSHLQKLFFDVLKLKPVNKGVNNVPKIDKAFQSEHSAVPEVKLYNAWTKACKLRNAYVNSMLGFWNRNEDFRSDVRIRCQYNYLKVITGRVSASNPNLQQIPSHSELGKHIKRIFIAGRGKFLVKVDFRVHEVRCWGIISQDSVVAEAFQLGKDLIDNYKVNPSKELLGRIKLEGDVHKVNSAYFFDKKIEEVTKEDRDAIKGVIFGLIYGMLLSTLARGQKREVADMKKIVDAFMKRFPKGTDWFETTKAFAKKNLYVQSPVGRRRRLYYIFSEKDSIYDKVKSYLDRRSNNSMVQGLGSDFMMIGIRSFCTRVWNYSVKNGYSPYIKPCVSVHDSLEVETDYAHLLLTLNYIEKSLTSDVKRIVKKRHNFDLISNLEIDYELGVTTDSLSGWYGDVDVLEAIVYKSLLAQNSKLNYGYSDEDIEETMNSVFANKEFMPEWMLEQVTKHKPRFLNYKFDVKQVIDA